MDNDIKDVLIIQYATPGKDYGGYLAYFNGDEIETAESCAKEAQKRELTLVHKQQEESHTVAEVVYAVTSYAEGRLAETFAVPAVFAKQEEAEVFATEQSVEGFVAEVKPLYLHSDSRFPKYSAPKEVYVVGYLVRTTPQHYGLLDAYEDVQSAGESFERLKSKVTPPERFVFKIDLVPFFV